MAGKGYRNVYALGVVSFFTDVSTEMVLGVLPIFIVRDLGATRALLGFIEGFAEMLNYGLRLLSGYVSDLVRRRKPLIFMGYLLSTVSKPLFSVAHTWFDALVIRSLDRAGKGVRTSPRDALLSQSVSEEEAGRAFGIHRTMDQAGAVVGPLLAFALLPFMGVRELFLISFIPGAAALLALLFLVTEVGGGEGGGGAGLVGNIFTREFILLVATLSAFNLGAYNFSFILLRAGDAGLPERFMPLLYMAINLIYTFTALPSGLLTDRIGGESTLLLAQAVFIASSALLASGGFGYGYVALVALVFGVYQGMYETVSRAILPKYVRPEYRGAAYGVYYLFIGLSFLLGITVIGYLWDTAGRAAAFGYSICLTALSMAGAYALKHTSG